MTRPPEAVVACLRAAGLVADAPWQPLQGGRCNRLWRVGGRVVKLYRPGGGVSPLFANAPDAEAAALDYLAGSGLAPPLRGRIETPSGSCLVYDHQPGRAWRAAPGAVGRVLARLHALRGPQLATDPGGAARLIRQTRAILAGCGGAAARWLAARAPGPGAPPLRRLSLVHGDAVPGNIISTRAGPVLIDWQSPARGDPCGDLALFLSPAMQALYRGRPLSAAERARFLGGYGDAATRARYRALAPLLHWRIAAHCLWRAQRGTPGYRRAFEFERAALPRPSRAQPPAPPCHSRRRAT